MTVTTTLDRQYFNGDGSNKNFPFNIKFFENSQIYVYLINSDGDAIGQTLNVDYTLSGAQNVSGGTVAFTTAPSVGTANVLVQRVLPFVQPTSIRNQGAFFPAIHEDVFDRLTMEIQQASAFGSNSLQKNAARTGWDFESLRGINAADPVNPQDVVTKSWFQLYLDGFSGAVNNTQNISYDTGSLYEYLRTSNNRVVNTISALRLLVGARNQRATTLGYYARGDGGASQYYLDSSDTTSADNGGSVIVGADGSRWKLVISGVVNVLQFGARGDGSTNDDAAFQAALTYSKVVRVPYKATAYVLTGVVLLPNNALLGDPWCKINHTGSGTLFTMRGSQTTVVGFDIDSSTSVTGAKIFLIDTANASMEYVYINRIKCLKPWVFLVDSGGANYCTNLHVTEISCRQVRGPGVSGTRLFAFVYFLDVTLDYLANGVAANVGGFALAGNAGAIFRDCDVLGTATDGSFPNQIGFNFASCAAVWIERCMSDTLGSAGFRISGCSNFYITDASASLCNGDGFVIGDTSSAITLNGCYAGGRGSLSGAVANLDGYRVVGGTNSKITFNACKATQNTGNGFEIATGSVVNSSACQSYNNLGRGLVSSGVTLNVGMQLASNGIGNYTLGTAFDHLAVSQLNSGALVTVTGPASA